MPRPDDRRRRHDHSAGAARSTLAETERRRAPSSRARSSPTAPSQAGRRRHDRRRRQRPRPDLQGHVRRHADRHRPPLRRLDDDAWWANHLTSKDALQVGQSLLIPPVSGVVVKVAASDTLEILAARYEVAEADIVDVNGLDDPNLVIGQTLIIPGAAAAMPTPTPKAPTPSRTTSRAAAAAAGRPAADARTRGGRFAWPVARRLHQPVLPLRPLGDRHRGRPRHAGHGGGQRAP